MDDIQGVFVVDLGSLVVVMLLCKEVAILSWKRLLVNLAIVFFVTYVVVLIGFGIIWDPNGAILLERPLWDILRIVCVGFYMSIPMGIGVFLSKHPVSMTLGLGYLAIAIISLQGWNTKIGQRILYALVALLTTLGTVKFFLLA